MPNKSTMEFSIIRHPEKVEVGCERSSIEEVNIPPKQKRKWAEICQRLEIDDPEITYESLTELEEMAKDIYEQLPYKALVLFTSSGYNRTKFAAEYLSSELEEIISKGEKKIYTDVIGEYKIKEGKKTVGVSNLPAEAPGMQKVMGELMKEENKIDRKLNDYLAEAKGKFTHPRELEIFLHAVNEDLSRPDSVLRERALELELQLAQLKSDIETKDMPVFIFGFGHMSSIVALDIINGKEKYESENEIAKPLELRRLKNKL